MVPPAASWAESTSTSAVGLGGVVTGVVVVGVVGGVVTVTSEELLAVTTTPRGSVPDAWAVLV